MPVPAWLVHHLLQYMPSTGTPICPPQYLILFGVTQETNVGMELSPKGVDLGKSLNSPDLFSLLMKRGCSHYSVLPVAEEIMNSEG